MAESNPPGRPVLVPREETVLRNPSKPSGEQCSITFGSKIADRIGKLHRKFWREEWNVGVIAQSAEEIFRNGITQPVRWLPQRSPWEMLADPSILTLTNGTCFLLTERMNHWSGRGEIWSAPVLASADLTELALEPWIRASCHLSYPFPFHDHDGSLWFMMESWESGALHLWQEREGTLRHIGPVIEAPVLDATPWYDGSEWWLFCTFRNDGSNERLQLFYASHPVGPWIAHPANPVKQDRGSSRPAGPLFWAGGKLVRPAQDCSRTYGGAIVLNEVVRLDHGGFQEVAVRRLAPDVAYPDGLHTLCPAGDQTIVDGKRWAFQALDVLCKPAAALQSRVRPLRRAGLPDCALLPQIR